MAMLTLVFWLSLPALHTSTGLPAAGTALALQVSASSTSLAPDPGSPPPLPVIDRDVDLVIYGTTTSAIGAVRALQRAGNVFGGGLEIAVIGGGPALESTIVQGLSVEDLYGSGGASGFYAEFRRAVIDEYAARGINATFESRLVVEPEVASGVLRWYLDKNGAGRQGVTFVRGRLVAAGDSGSRYVLVNTGEAQMYITTRYFIDASPEGDLARLLGAEYRMGRSEEVYNDAIGYRAPRPSRANDYATAPQSMSMLLTLQLYSGTAPDVASLGLAAYNPQDYGKPGFTLSEWAQSSFATSWSLRHVLPNSKRELNEAWGDYANPDISFDWVMFPEKRAAIRDMMQNWILNKVRYLQRNGHPSVGVATVPTWPYVRDGVRIRGLATYTAENIANGLIQHPVTYGVYALFDRHDTVYGSRQDSTTGYVHVPMESLLVAGHPWLLVSTAVSTDSAAGCSAVRMEPVRANMGGAAGIMVAIAAASNAPLHYLDYTRVRDELLRQGYQL